MLNSQTETPVSFFIQHSSFITLHSPSVPHPLHWRFYIDAMASIDKMLALRRSVAAVRGAGRTAVYNDRTAASGEIAHQGKSNDDEWTDALC